MNYTLSLFFDLLNKQILTIKDFNVDDLIVTSNFLKVNSADLKKGLEVIISEFTRIQVKLNYSKILDLNLKYKKFEEIIFLLNSGLKEIKGFVLQSKRRINIDCNELISLIQAIFEKSDFRDEVIIAINLQFKNWEK